MSKAEEAQQRIMTMIEGLERDAAAALEGAQTSEALADASERQAKAAQTVADSGRKHAANLRVRAASAQALADSLRRQLGAGHCGACGQPVGWEELMQLVTGKGAPTA